MKDNTHIGKRFAGIEKYVDAKQHLSSIENIIEKHQTQVHMRRKSIHKYNSFSIAGK